MARLLLPFLPPRGVQPSWGLVGKHHLGTLCLRVCVCLGVCVCVRIPAIQALKGSDP